MLRAINEQIRQINVSTNLNFFIPSKQKRMKIKSILMTYWAPGHSRGKRLAAAANGGKIFSIGHVEYGRWGTGGDWW